MQEYKNRVEAILFTTGKFMDLEEISRLCGIASQGMLRDIITGLKTDYSGREGALQLLEENGRFKLNIKKQYGYLTSKLLSDCELDKPVQETLGIIAYKNPVIQSDVIKVRGSTAYDHIKFLKENGFVTSERHGRTRLLKLAPKFFEYFDVLEETLQAQVSEVNEKFKEEHQETLKEMEEETSSETEEEGSQDDSEITEDQEEPTEEEEEEENSQNEELD